MKTYPLLALLLLATTALTHSFHSLLDAYLQHGPLSPGQVPQQQVRGRLLATPSPVRAQMRIELDTTMFNNPISAGTNGATTTTQARLNFLLRTMLVTKTFYESRLQVGQTASITAPSNCVGFTPSTTAQTSGYANADLLIFVHYLTDTSLTYGATGKSCKYFPGTATTGSPDLTLQVGRPIVGRLIFNTYNIIDQLSALTNRQFQSITSTALHETMHILGFDSTLYTSYLDPSTGAPYTSPPKIAGTVNANRPATSLLTTPYVLAWAIAYFGCPSLAGMPLENEDGTGAGSESHWERTAMYDELMTGTSLGTAKYFSGLSFALLKDTGWYSVDDSFAATSNYGYQKGCSFLTEACYGNSFTEFCNSAASASNSYCGSNFIGKSICTNTAGLMADGCGMYGEYFSCIDPNSQDSSYQAYTYEVYATNSFCLDSTLGSVVLPSNLISRCYPYVCGTSSVTFTIGTYSITCLSTEAGVKKTLSALAGYLTCPDFTHFCTISRKTCPSFCSQNGYCMDGVCNCYTGYSGPDCTQTSCSASQYYDPPNTVCVAQCPTGYYANKFSRSCLPCSSPCSECANRGDNCVGCQPVNGATMYFYNNNCYSVCPSGTYTLPNSTCLTCDSSVYCSTCTGSATTCTSCQTPYYLDQPVSGSCAGTCTGTYSLQNEVTRVCVTSCDNNQIAPGNGSCVLCGPGLYISSGACGATCVSGFYPDQTLRACLTCDTTCLACDGHYPQNCTSCKSTGGNNYLLLKMCWAICPKGFSANPTSRQCEVCPVELFCTACSYNAATTFSECTICQYGTYYQVTTRTCNSQCLTTQYRNTWNNSCNSCDPACATCNGPTQFSCLSCPNTHYLLSNSSGGHCLTTCPTLGYIQIGTQCQACDPTCSSCNGVAANNCFNCKANYYLSTGYCRYVCPSGTYSNGTTWECLACDPSCSYCFSSTPATCTSCATGLYLYNFTCAATCPNGMTPNQWNVCYELTLALPQILILLLLLLALASP